MNWSFDDVRTATNLKQRHRIRLQVTFLTAAGEDRLFAEPKRQFPFRTHTYKVRFLIVLEDNATHAPVSEELHDLAYDVMLEFGPVVELHVCSETEFQTFVNEGNPFIQNVLHEGRSYAC